MNEASGNPEDDKSGIGDTITTVLLGAELNAAIYHPVKEETSGKNS